MALKDLQKDSEAYQKYLVYKNKEARLIESLKEIQDLLDNLQLNTAFNNAATPAEKSKVRQFKDFVIGTIDRDPDKGSRLSGIGRGRSR